MWDTGTNVGDISGHNKAINSVAYKPTRPFRVATAGEDCKSGFFEGPPFKLKRIVHVGADASRVPLTLSLSQGPHSFL